MANANKRSKAYDFHIIGQAGVAEVVESAPGALGFLVNDGHVIGSQNDVLGWSHDRLARARREHVVCAEHHAPSLCDRLSGQWQVDGHLVAVEVSVEGRADQRMHLDSRAVDQHRLECLNAKTVQRGRSVEKHWPVLDDLFEDVPDLWPDALCHSFCALDVMCVAFHDKPVHDEGLE